MKTKKKRKWRRKCKHREAKQNDIINCQTRRKREKNQNGYCKKKMEKNNTIYSVSKINS